MNNHLEIFTRFTGSVARARPMSVKGVRKLKFDRFHIAGGDVLGSHIRFVNRVILGGILRIVWKPKQKSASKGALVDSWAGFVSILGAFILAVLG